LNAFTLVLVAVIVFLGAYATYGAWLAKKWGVDINRKTPAHTQGDGVDYVPASAPVLLGHHFASIAGAGPILGPIQAAVFGWLPVFLWIVIGSVFVGGVQDFGSLFASVRHDGKTIGEIIEVNMGKSGKKLFTLFAWLTLVLVVAAFINVTANTFVSVPEAGTASLLFIVLAVVFGYFVHRKNAPLVLSTVVGVALLFACIWIGFNNPLVLSKNTWSFILLAYIFVASVAPVWMLLQPRDYLNSFLLYSVMGGALLGLLLYRPTLQLEAFTSFKVGSQYMFPMLFVIVACGAISGFHSLVGSGTSSKQIDKESDIKLVGYGSMLIEGVLATIAIITAAYLSKAGLGELLAKGGPITVFSTGVGTFMSSFGLDIKVGTTFAALAISAFALTTLDTATRIGRFVFQEFFSSLSNKDDANHVLTNRYVSTTITVAAGGTLAFAGWSKIWPMFGSANQLLAALSLLAIAVWLANIKKENRMVIVPTVFMFAVTLTALVFLMRTHLATKNYTLLGIAAVLFVLALVLIAEGYKALTKKGASRPPSIKA
jgi:carbon starvation protein